MASVGQEGSAVGEHTYKSRKQTELGKRLDLAGHAFELVVEPPTASELHFASRDAVLEVSDHSGNDFIVARIEVVNDRLGQAILTI